MSAGGLLIVTTDMSYSSTRLNPERPALVIMSPDGMKIISVCPSSFFALKVTVPSLKLVVGSPLVF